MHAMEPVHIFKAAGLKALDLVIAGMLLFSMGIVVALLIIGYPAWVSVLFLGGAVPAAIIWMLLPRRFEVWPDRIVIVFPVLFRWNLPFDSIESVDLAKWWHAYAFMGTRLASSPGSSVDIVRRRHNVLTRPNIVISPEHREEFVERANEALERHRPG
jgi:hypothetical protein